MPLQLTVTGSLYQPLAFACRAGVAVTAVGAVVSYLSGKSAIPVLPAASVQLVFGSAVPLSGPL